MSIAPKQALKQHSAGSKRVAYRQKSKQPESASRKLASANESPNAPIDHKNHRLAVISPAQSDQSVSALRSRHPLPLTDGLRPYRQGDHDTAHHIVQFKITSRAMGMSIMATDTGLSHGNIGIDRLKIPPSTAVDVSRIRLLRLFQNGF